MFSFVSHLSGTFLRIKAYLKTETFCHSSILTQCILSITDMGQVI